MDRWTDLSQVPDDGRPAVVTLGNFDGVHLGHQAVLATVVREARQRDARAVAITFDPHPLAVLYPDRAPAQLAGLEHRLELMATTGLDAVLVLTFTRELSTWSPERFVEEVIVRGLRARAVVVGHDVRFGHRNAGDLQTFRDLGARLGFDVVALDDVGAPDSAGRRWSSTQARTLLQSGDVAAAAEVLGRPHRVTGEVVHGDHRGRELGYPTANLSPSSEGLVPQDGVYAGWLVLLEAPEGSPDRVLPAAISIGTNPTFAGHHRRVEAYALDRTDLDLYGQRVAIDFVQRLRDTLTFDGVDPLLAQMALDVKQCRELLGPRLGGPVSR